MEVFPTLSREVSATLKELPSSDGDIKNESDSGYIISRRRFTRSPKSFTVVYSYLDDDDYLVLEEFIDLVGSTEIFQWVHPTSNRIYEVRFEKRPGMSRDTIYWSLPCTLVEA